MATTKKTESNTRTIDCPAEAMPRPVVNAKGEIDVEASLKAWRPQLAELNLVRKADSDLMKEVVDNIFAEVGASYLIKDQIVGGLFAALTGGKMLAPAAHQAIKARITHNLPRLVRAEHGRGKGMRKTTDAERAQWDLTQTYEPADVAPAPEASV